MWIHYNCGANAGYAVADPGAGWGCTPLDAVIQMYTVWPAKFKGHGAINFTFTALSMFNHTRNEHGTVSVQACGDVIKHPSKPQRYWPPLHDDVITPPRATAHAMRRRDGCCLLGKRAKRVRCDGKPDPSVDATPCPHNVHRFRQFLQHPQHCTLCVHVETHLVIETTS